MIQVVDNPFKPPGKCGFCGSPGRDGRNFLDTGFRFPKFGTLYICKLCVIDLSKHFEFGPVAELKEQVEHLSKEVKELNEENEQFRSALGIVNRFSDSSSVSISSVVDTDKDAESPGEDKQRSSKNDSQSSKPSTERGSENLSDSGGTDDDSEFILDGDFKL